jgi:NAD(P)-dependent dehydrogenase (short-subunit alcohol dehydrogenase family)
MPQTKNSRIAVVTGGQRGIGLGIARSLAAEGFVPVIVAEREPDCEEVAAALEHLGSRAHYLNHDLRDIDGVDGLVAQIECEIGPIACLISNAGVAPETRRDILDVTAESYARVNEVNAMGAFFMAQAVSRRMIARTGNQGYRSMVFVTSVSATHASLGRAEYCISKAAAAMIAQLFALRLAGSGIGVFDVRPGLIRTAMTEGVADTYDRLIEDGWVPDRRWGGPEDVGRVCAMLASGAMDYATGAVIPVDGGLAIPRL